MHEEYTKHVCADITGEIKNFVNDGVFGDSEYLFVTKEKGKNQGYCSKCNHEYHVENLHHNERGICPICGASLTVKLSRYGRKNCRNEACFYYFEKSIIDSNVIVCKGYYVTKDYSKDYKNPREEYALCAIYIFEDKKATMLKNSWYSDRWEIRSSVFDFNQGWLAPKMCCCSFESIGEAIQGTSFQYIPYKMFQGNYSMVKVFKEYSKYPWIEQISKIGFVDIVKSKLEGRYMYNCLNYKGKTIFKILKLSRKDVKDIKESGEYITPLFLSLYQMQVKDKSGLSPEEVTQIETYGYDYVKLKNILKHTTMKKAFRYMEKQYEKYHKKYYGKSGIVTTWSDYIEDCLKLGMDISEEHVLYPKDVHAVHQSTISQVKIKENKKYDEQIKERANKLKKYMFEYDELLIRPASSSKELIEEGATLNHCVATYAERYAKGETNIFLIRKLNEIDKPYYTMEVQNNKIMQTRGNKNCSPNEEIKKLIKIFMDEKLNKKKSKVKISA